MLHRRSMMLHFMRLRLENRLWEAQVLVSPRLMLKPQQGSCAVQGSSTACVLALEGDTLHAANLGDSGFMVVRRNKVHYKSRSQQHQFNFPYQLGRGGRMPFDSPSMAEVRPLLSSQLPLGCVPRSSTLAVWLLGASMELLRSAWTTVPQRTECALKAAQTVHLRRGAVCFPVVPGHSIARCEASMLHLLTSALPVPSHFPWHYVDMSRSWICENLCNSR